jgi:hypothetical protein
MEKRGHLVEVFAGPSGRSVAQCSRCGAYGVGLSGPCEPREAVQQRSRERARRYWEGYTSQLHGCHYPRSAGPPVGLCVVFVLAGLFLGFIVWVWIMTYGT